MNKVLIAIDNNEIFKNIIEMKKYNIFEKDIIYKEGIFEVLERNKEIDFLIVSNDIYGNVDFEKFILKIKEINKSIKVFIFLDKKDKVLINFLNSNEIYNIYDIEELTYKNIIEILESETFEKSKISEEISILKNMINIEEFGSCTKNKEGKVIIFTGEKSVGKTMFSTGLSQYVENIKKKVLLITLKENKTDVEILFKCFAKEDKIITISKNLDLLYIPMEKDIEFNEIKKLYKYIVIDLSSNANFSFVKYVFENSNKIFFIIEPSLLGVNKASVLLERYLKETSLIEYDVEIIFNRFDRYSLNKYILKKIFKEYKIRGFCHSGKIKNFIKKKILKKRGNKYEL